VKIVAVLTSYQTTRNSIHVARNVEDLWFF